jgi:long-chain fatty acid transport protein
MGADLALGAGFEVAELSGRTLGNAYAGKAASGDDAAIVYWNPAGMTLFKQHHVSIPFHLLVTRGDWDDEGSLSVTGTTLGGGDGGDPGDSTPIPNIYGIYSFSDDIKFGIAINAPFGLKTEYDDDWQGRYFGTESELKTININPAVAYRLDETFSLGLGVSAQHAEATLKNQVDYGTIVFSQAGPQGGVFPESADGEAELEGDSWAFGINAGMLMEISETTRIGIAWRSRVVHQIKDGDAEFSVPGSASILKQAGLFKDTDADTRIGLPEQAYFSIFHQLNEEWDLLLDVTWTGWSRFNKLNVDFDNPAQPNSVTEYDWSDAMRYAVGATYRPMPELAIRFGGAFDESPIKDENRTPRIPTNDRWWLAIGAAYQVDDMFSVDLAWMHVFIRDGDIDLNSSTGQRLKGEFSGDADVFAIQVNVTF